MKTQTAPCPKCGHTDGWYCKIVMSYEQYYTPDGVSDSYEGKNSRGGNKKFCAHCGKDITRIIK
jgi:hypothetical protein